MIVESLGPLLERSGFHLLVASNGEEALSKAQSHRPDVIVMDVLMPRMNGREVLRRMRKLNIWIPTILLTQVGEASERAVTLEEGADDYLNKPFDPHELLARIRTKLRVKSAEDRLRRDVVHDGVGHRRAARVRQDRDAAPRRQRLGHERLRHVEHLADVVFKGGNLHEGVGLQGGPGVQTQRERRRGGVHLEDGERLGPEAVRRLMLKDFPLIVANDIHGGDLFEAGVKEYASAG